MKDTKKVLAFLCAVSILLGSAARYHAYSYIKFPEAASYQNSELFSDGTSAFYLVGTEGADVTVQMIRSGGSSTGRSLTLDNSCTAFDAYGGKAYFTARLSAQDDGGAVRQTSVTVCEISSGRTDVTFFNHVFVSNRYHFAAGGGKYYMVDSTQRKVLKAFSEDGGALFEAACPGNILQLLYDHRQEVLFVLTADALYCLRAGQTALSYCGGGAEGDFLSLAGGGLLSDARGGVLRFSGGTVKTLFRASGVSGQTGAAAAGGNIYFYHSGRVDGYRISSGQRVASLDLGGSLDSFCALPDKMAGYSKKDGTVIFLSKGDIPDLPTEKPTQPSGDSSQAPSGGGKITSNVYSIDYGNGLITGIKSGTTIAKFKENISYNGYKASFKSYSGAAKTSGNAATGMTAYFSDQKGNIKYEFVLVVPGDITGEGNVNSSDKRLAMKILLGESKVSFPFVFGLDANGDGTFDTLDLLRIAKGG